MIAPLVFNIPPLFEPKYVQAFGVTKIPERTPMCAQKFYIRIEHSQELVIWMPKFLVVHKAFPTPLSVEQAVPLLKRACGAMTAEAYWISAMCQANAEGKAVKVWCRWDGVSLEAVRDAVAKLIPEMPAEGVYPLLTLDSGDFR